MTYALSRVSAIAEGLNNGAPGARVAQNRGWGYNSNICFCFRYVDSNMKRDSSRALETIVITVRCTARAALYQCQCNFVQS